MAKLLEDISPEAIEQGVPEHAQTMTIEKVFWSHFTPNLLPSAWVIGMLLPLLGLDFWSGLLAIVLGNLLGALPVALASLMGPHTGLTQIEAGRMVYGKLGMRLPAAVNWLLAVGWDAVNNVPATVAFLALLAMAGLDAPFWLVLALLVFVQMLIGIYGHHLVQATQKFFGFGLLAAFGAIGALAVIRGGALSQPSQPASLSMLVLAVAIVGSYNLGWTPFASDYTRYLPKSTSDGAIFWRTCLGLVASASLIEIFGLLTAGAVGEPTPIGMIAGIGSLTGALAPLALLAIGLSAIPSNAMNDNTAAYSLISAGIHVSRPIAAAVAALASFGLAVYGAGQYATFYTDFLLLMSYWVAPWAAIVLAHWSTNRAMSRQPYPLGWTRATSIFALVTPLSILLFAATPMYRGPLAAALGGADIGYFVGFLAAGGLYLATTPRVRTKVSVA